MVVCVFIWIDLSRKEESPVRMCEGKKEKKSTPMDKKKHFCTSRKDRINYVINQKTAKTEASHSSFTQRERCLTEQQ
jgi:hypothetical protein